MSDIVPDTHEFIEALEDIVKDWYEFGIHLKLPIKDLDRIEADYRFQGGIMRCMIEMHKVLLGSHLGSWANIELALGKMGKQRLAIKIRKRYEALTINPRQDAVLPSDCHGIMVGEDLTSEFERLRHCLLDLEFTIKKSIQKENVPFYDVLRVVMEYYEINALKEHNATMDMLFIEMSQCYCFMNYDVLVDLVNRFLGDDEKVRQQLANYETQLHKFKESTTLQQLMEEIHKQRIASHNQKEVKIKLQNFWKDVRIKKFEEICENIFRSLYKHLVHIRVEKGCICMSWLVHDKYHEKVSAAVNTSSKLLNGIGVVSVTIDKMVIYECTSEPSEDMASAMFKATRNGDTPAMKILIAIGGNPNTSLANGHTLLMKSSSSGHQEMVQLLISISHVDVNAVSDIGITALALASTKGHSTIATLLIEAGADPDISNNEQQTPLMMASNEGHTEVVQVLLKAKANVNATTRLLETAILRASLKGHVTIVLLLLIAGADPNIVDQNGLSPLIVASQEGHSEIVKELLEFRSKVNATTTTCHQTALYLSSLGGHATTVHELLEAGADPNMSDKQDRTPIMVASHKGHTQVVDLLKDRTENIDTTNQLGRTALYEASLSGHMNVVDMLLKAGADPNIGDNKGRTPLIEASSKGHTDVVNLLLIGGGNVIATTLSGRTSVLKACFEGHCEIVSLLHKAGADLNKPDNEGVTPLIAASANGHESVTRYLLKANVTVDAINKRGRTALFEATLRGHSAVLSVLLKAGADPNIPDTEGATPLIASIIKGHKYIASILILCIKTQINYTTQNGNTALHYAVKYGHTDIVRQLVNAGATISLKNEQQQTPIDLANDHNIAEILRAREDRRLHTLQVSSRNTDLYSATYSPSSSQTIQTIGEKLGKKFMTTSRDSGYSSYNSRSSFLSSDSAEFKRVLQDK